MAGTIFDKLDRPRKFRFDLAASMAAENVLGVGLHKAIEELSGPRFYIVLLWAGLSRHEQNITVNDVRKLVQRALSDKKLTMFELQRFILEHIRDSDVFSGMEDDEPGEEGEEKVPLASPAGSETD